MSQKDDARLSQNANKHLFFVCFICIKHYVVMSDVPLINQYYREASIPTNNAGLRIHICPIDCPISDNTGIYTATEKVI